MRSPFVSRGLRQQRRETDPTESIVVKRSLAGPIVVAVLSAAGVAVGFVFIPYPSWACWVVTIVSYMFLQWAVVELYQRPPVLIANGAGMGYRGWPVDFFTWEEIEEVFLVTENGGAKFFCLMLREPGLYRQKAGAAHRWLHNVTLANAHGDLDINVSKLRLDVDALLRFARKGIGEVAERRAERKT